MNILLSSVDFLPRIGGISLMTHYLGLALAAQSHKVVVFAPKFPDDVVSKVAADTLDEANTAYEIVWDDRYHHPVKEGAGLERFRNDTLPILNGLHNLHAFDRAIVLHFDTYGAAIEAFCTNANVPMSVFVHGFELTSLYSRRATLAQFAARLSNAGQSRRDAALNTLKAADEILTNSNFTAQALQKLTRLKGHPIGCGLSPNLEAVARSDCDDIDKWRHGAKARLDQAFPVAKGKTVISTVARLTKHKNVALLVDAVARDPDLFAIIVGDGPELPSLQRQAKQTACAERVAFVGMATEKEKTEYLMASDVFALLSLRDPSGAVEGFGIALLEAIACGAVVVSTGTGGMADIVRHRETGLITPNDPQKLAEMIRLVASDNALSKTLAMRAKALINERYNWQSIALRMTNRWQSAAS